MGEAPRVTSPRAQKPAPPAALRRYVLERLGAGRRRQEFSGPCRIGSAGSNDLVLDEPTVSSLHCEIDVAATGAWIRDDGSSNGTEVDGLPVREAALRDGSLIGLGNVTLRFGWGEAEVGLREDEGGPIAWLVGSSTLMRDCRARLASVARSSAPVLLEGESGTGKSLAAEALHELRGLQLLPLLVVECGAVPEADLSGLLWGRDRPRRLSLFEQCGAGTVLLDEVGALSLELQARLVPVFERRELTRPGSPVIVPVRAHLIATAREPLRRRVNAGQFRPELYYRLGTAPVRLPPLRDRLEDLPELIDAWLARQEAPLPDEAAALRSRVFQDKLKQVAWPGNVRELFNHLERCLLLHRADSPRQLAAPAVPTDASRPYVEAREAAVMAFERDYVEALLALHQGNVARAARAAGMDRAYLHRLLRRHGLRRT